MEESDDLLETSNVLKKSDFEFIHHPLLNKAPDFTNTELNTTFADQTNLSRELTCIYAPALYARSNFEYERSPGDGSSIRWTLFKQGASAMQNMLTATHPGKPQSGGIGVSSTCTYQNIEPHKAGRSLQIIKDKPRKRNRDPTRALLPGPNPYGRRGTLKCQLCRRSRLKVDLYGRNLILVYFYS